MLTPQEVAEHAFSKASFGGYNMAMVDEFLDLLTADYTTLYKENAVLKTKMKILVEKVEEYRSTEDAMRKALLTAQQMADKMIAEAEQQKAAILEQAEAQARARIGELRQETENERARLAAAQTATISFVEQANRLCQREMDFLTSLGSVTASEPQADPVAQVAEEIEQAVGQTVTAEDAPVQPLVTQSPGPSAARYEEPEDTVDLGDLLPAGEMDPEVPGGLYAELMELNLGRSQGDRLQPVRAQEQEPAAPAHEEIDDSPTRRVDLNKLNNLQFGKQYEIK